MAKKRPSIADIMQEDAPAPVAPELRPSGVVVPWVPPVVETATAPQRAAEGQGERLRVRKDKPHTTIFLDHAVRTAIKRIALDYNKKPHDLMLEGIDMMLTKYAGKTIKDYTT